MSRLLASLSKDELTTAEELCGDILKNFEGRTVAIAGVSLALAVEFLVKKDMFEKEDFASAVEAIADFKDMMGIDGGHIDSYNSKETPKA